MNRDLSVGEPRKVLWQFCLPLFGSVLFQQLYNIADSFVAGKFLGEAALASVGNSYEITLIFLAFAFGCNIGCSVITSQLFGAKNFRDMKSAVYTSLLSCAAVCITLMTLGLVFGEKLLFLIHTPPELMADSLLYLRIYIFGLPFVFFYNIATGIFSALGDSKTPFWFLAASSTVNVGVDILFVTSLSMGVDGVAWATFLCQGVSCILSLIFVFRRFRKIKTDEKPVLFSGKLFRKLAAIAIPSILQQSFVSVGNILIQSVINTFGSGVIAGYAASIKLNNLVITSFNTLGNGISNFTAQNRGAGKPERIRKGFSAGLLLMWSICVPAVLLYLLCGRTLVHFFLTTPSAEAMHTGILLLRIVAPFYFVAAAKLTADGVLRGSEKMRQFMIGTFTDLLLRVVLAFILSKPMGETGIWIAWPIGWSVAAAISLFFYYSLMKKQDME